jgi:hypothetical protein
MTKIQQSTTLRQFLFRTSRAMRWLTASFASLCFASSAHALTISDDVFIRNGGNLANIPATITTAMGPLRQASLASQFLSVGDFGDCTATWLGDTPNGESSVFLTAAHCAEDEPVKKKKGPFSRTFSDWSGRIAASGTGSYVLGPYRKSIPQGMGGASTDIAIVTLPKKANILDQTGAAVPQPVIYDGNDELNKQVWLAGYGLWGTGPVNTNWDYWPSSVSLRAAGASTVDGIFESNFGIRAGFNPKVGGNFATRAASGDSGSAWWQQHDGEWVIIATTNGGSDLATTGARVSKYTDWIRSVYPQAKFSSDGYTITKKNKILTTPNFALDAKNGTVAYVVPSQANAIGPTSLKWDGNCKPTMVKVTVQDQSNRTAVIQLRTQRDIGCGPSYLQEMNAAVSCYSNRSGPLIVTYRPADNRDLAAGTYVGSFTVEARGWQDSSYVRAFQIKVNIVVK